MNASVGAVPFRELARRNMVDLAAIEREIFAFTFSNGKPVPVQPRYWGSSSGRYDVSVPSESIDQRLTAR